MAFQKCLVMVMTITIIFSVNAKPWKKRWNKPKGGKVFQLVLDGVVHNYDQLSDNLPNFAKLARSGVKAKRMVPVFPTNTFPNMETLNTGLYAESHGIINNHIFDESTNRFVDLNNVKEGAKFYTSEPVWLTNQKQGGKSNTKSFLEYLIGPAILFFSFKIYSTEYKFAIVTLCKCRRVYSRLRSVRGYRFNY